MITKIRRISITCLLATIFALPLALACGPDFTGPTFISLTGSDIPYSQYAHGRLGLLQPTYWHEPLYIAYRNLSGKPLSSSELAAFTPLPEDRSAAPEANWVEAWKSARSKFAESPAREQQLYSNGYGIARQLDRPETYVEYYNCLDNAFQNAVQTLRQRVGQFGAESQAIKEWVAAQDQVFENCSSAPGYPPKPKPAIIPAAAHATDPATIRADRAYQIAAAHFYAGDYALAQSAFEAIADDPASPYNKLAPYLVARVLIRKGTLDTGDNEFDLQTLGQAETKLRAILADKNLAEMHAPAARLLGFVTIRLHRQKRFEELETSLAAGTAKDFRQDFTDYLWLLDHRVLTKIVTTPAADGHPEQKGVATDESSRLKNGEMTDWIDTFQQAGDAAYRHSLERWHETKSLPWLVAATVKAPANDKAVTELFAAVEKLPADSPAFVTVNFHRLRVLDQSGKSGEGRRGLDQFLAQHGAALSSSAKNEFAALRMKLAANFQEFLQFAPRYTNDAAAYPNPPEGGAQTARAVAPHFDADASIILTERLPLRLVADAAKSETLPKSLRREVAIAAWTRAILLDDHAIARELVPTTQELVPEIKDALAEYASAADSDREFVAVSTILRDPGFRPFVTAGYARGNLYTVGEPAFDKIDNLHDNWWCSLAPANPNEAYGQNYYRMFIALSAPLQEIYSNNKRLEPSFLTDDQRAAAAEEHAILEKQPAAPSWLGQRAMDWANAHPEDPRVPEALHNVVRARRYGCADVQAVAPEKSSEPAAEQKEIPNYSKLAFELLHKRYPDSEWTKKTPYWFE